MRKLAKTMKTMKTMKMTTMKKLKTMKTMKKPKMMMMKKCAAIAMALALLAMAGAVFMGCARAGAAAPAPEPGPAPAPEQGQEAASDGGIVLTDMLGREVRLDAPATRVVALMAADVEILYAIGAADTLVGRGEYCDYPAEALEVQSVKSGNETNVEQLIALRPQLLILTSVAQSEEQTRQLEDAGIVTFVTDAQDIEGVYTVIGLIGRLVGKESEAESVIGNMKQTFDELRKNVVAAAGEEKSIYFEVSPLEFGLWTAGSGTFMNEVAEMLGLRNIFSDISSWGEISEEQVLERNPEFIMTVGMYFGDGPTPIESILGRAGWESIDAIKNKAILNISTDELSRPGPRLADGAKVLYEFVYEGGTATP